MSRCAERFGNLFAKFRRHDFLFPQPFTTSFCKFRTQRPTLKSEEISTGQHPAQRISKKKQSQATIDSTTSSKHIANMTRRSATSRGWIISQFCCSSIYRKRRTHFGALCMWWWRWGGAASSHASKTRYTWCWGTYKFTLRSVSPTCMQELSSRSICRWSRPSLLSWLHCIAMMRLLRLRHVSSSYSWWRVLK